MSKEKKYTEEEIRSFVDDTIQKAILKINVGIFEEVKKVAITLE